MEVCNITENEDGSATLDVKLKNEEVQLLLEDAITRALKNYIKEKENEQKVHVD